MLGYLAKDRQRYCFFSIETQNVLRYSLIWTTRRVEATNRWTRCLSFWPRKKPASCGLWQLGKYYLTVPVFYRCQRLDESLWAYQFLITLFQCFQLLLLTASYHVFIHDSVASTSTGNPGPPSPLKQEFLGCRKEPVSTLIIFSESKAATLASPRRAAALLTALSRSCVEGHSGLETTSRWLRYFYTFYIVLKHCI